ncbi:MAG: helix-turn-helix transcriptional regulator [Betaproteobacteria bacterium]|nr:helix-turn-helix transcriptional regulator [Betaproteobacteria bacterium]
MAIKKSVSPLKKLLQELPQFHGDLTRWSYCMQGAFSEEIDDGAVAHLTAAFGSYHPQWLIDSKPWRKVQGESFKMLRQTLRLSITQAAAYLRVKPTTIARWENEKSRTPFAALEAFRLLLASVHFKCSHRIWDGWFISAEGTWVSPNVGKLAFKPYEFDYLPQLHADNSKLRFENDRLRVQIDEANAENTRLRKLFQEQGVTKELRRMHGRIGELIAGTGTADVVDFSVTKPATKPRRKAA